MITGIIKNQKEVMIIIISILLIIVNIRLKNLINIQIGEEMINTTKIIKMIDTTKRDQDTAKTKMVNKDQKKIFIIRRNKHPKSKKLNCRKKLLKKEKLPKKSLKLI
jgi:hypothetical protein